MFFFFFKSVIKVSLLLLSSLTMSFVLKHTVKAPSSIHVVDSTKIAQCFCLLNCNCSDSTRLPLGFSMICDRISLSVHDARTHTLLPGSTWCQRIPSSILIWIDYEIPIIIIIVWTNRLPWRKCYSCAGVGEKRLISCRELSRTIHCRGDFNVVRHSDVRYDKNSLYERRRFFYEIYVRKWINGISGENQNIGKNPFPVDRNFTKSSKRRSSEERFEHFSTLERPRGVYEIRRRFSRHVTRNQNDIRSYVACQWL